MADLFSSLNVPPPTNYGDYAAIAAFIAGLGLYASKGKVWDRPDRLEHLLYEKPQLKKGGAVQKQKEVRNIRKKVEETVSG